MSGELFPFDGFSGAEISDDGLFRYRLWRNWAKGRQMTFVMLNPSTADAAVDDPTIRRCLSFAKREGCGSLEVVNLYPYRTSKPKVLIEARDAGIDITGGITGRQAIVRALRRADTHGDIVVAAWGAHPEARDGEHRRIIDTACRIGAPVRCLGVTKDGHPRHPLYLKTDAPLVAWPAP